MTKEAASKDSRSAGPAPVRYSERLTTPWWWYIVGLAVAAVLAGEFRIADHALTIWIPYGLLLPGSALIVWAMGRHRLIVDAEALTVRDARLPLWAVQAVIPLDATTLRRLVGRFGDPAAFIANRPWIGPGVQIILDDAEDPTPYWVVSTRHPDRLAAALATRPAAGA